MEMNDFLKYELVLVLKLTLRLIKSHDFSHDDFFKKIYFVYYFYKTS